MQLLFPIALVASFALLNAPTIVQAASSQGSIQLYSDSNCTTPSGIAVMLAVNTCLPSIQVAGIAAISFPSCANGRPLLYISDYSQCTAPSISPADNSGIINYCLFFTTGSYIGSAAFVCVGNVTTISDNQPATATETSSAAATESTPANATTSTPATSTTTSIQRQPSGQNVGSSSGLSVGGQIALGLGLGLGLPTLVVGFLAWYYDFWDWQEAFLRSRLRLVPYYGAPPPYELHVRN